MQYRYRQLSTQRMVNAMPDPTHIAGSLIRTSVALLWMISASCFADSPVTQDRNVATAKISAQCSVEVELRSDERPACWQLLCDSAKPFRLGCDLTHMHQVTSLSISPDRQRLAVMSVGEGHPMLELVDLTRLLERHEYSALCTINPFPGTLNVIGWDKSAVLVASDVPLTMKDTEQRVFSISAEEMHFRITADGCTVEPAP